METTNPTIKYKRSATATKFTPRMIAYFRECFTYNKTTGVLRWRKDRPARHFAHLPSHGRYLKVNAGKPAGTPQGGDGHLQVQFSRHPTKKGKRNFCAYVHRIAYALVTGEDLPAGCVMDHKNGDSGDNRWSNLRIATAADNSHNRKVSRTSNTGVLGVNAFDYKGKTKYRATLQADGTRFDKTFNSLQAATEQRHAWERLHHGRFAAHLSRPTLQ